MQDFNNLNFDYLSKYDENEIDKYLDFRDSEEFESDWLKSYEELNKVGLNDNVKLELEKIRESVFKKVFKETSNGDISAYISDDFELIYKNVILGNKSVYVSNLLEFYKNNQLPK